MKHYSKIIFQILFTKYSYSRLRLLLDYLQLIIKSIIHHKIKRSGIKPNIQYTKLAGFEIGFFTYQQIINLVEEIFIFQVYKFSTTQQMPIIIDGGSNIGLSIFYFKSLYPTAQIIAFEPDRETYDLLERNILVNKLSNIKLYNCALGTHDHHSALYKRTVSNGSLNMSLIAAHDKPYQEIVQTGKLSSYIHNQKVDMLKLDVEGAEPGIIEDLVHSYKIRQIKKMIIEFHPDIIDTSVEEFVFLLMKNDFSVNRTIDVIHPGATEVMISATNKYTEII